MELNGTELSILSLSCSYVLAIFLIAFLLRLRVSRSRVHGPRVVARRTIAAAFLVYVLPLVLMLLFAFFKVILIEKYTMHQYRQYARFVVFDGYNEFYVGIWDKIVLTVKRMG